MRLLVTRPQPDAERTAAVLRARGHAVLVMPVLRIEPTIDVQLGSRALSHTLSQSWAGILMTSANAVRATAQHSDIDALRQLPVFAVGEKTRAAAESAGFLKVISADGDAAALAALVASRLGREPPGPLLYLAGEERTGDLELVLSRQFAVDTVVVYRAVMVSELTPPVVEALSAGALDGVLHFSRRSVEALLAAASGAGLHAKVMALRHYCLSTQVAAGLEGATVHVAAHPDEQTLLALIG
jgi:uroporphyrinogen-III synthase